MGVKRKAEEQLSATQLRNARKRAANKKDKKEVRTQQDPSLQYIADPLQTPMVLEAQQFFRGLGNCGQTLPVHLGPLQGWRTSAKLA
ncbi:unnamed protein product, partial [Polarella glacialis]